MVWVILAAQPAIADRDKHPKGWLFKCLFPSIKSEAKFFGENGTTLTPTGILEVSDGPIDQKYRIRASVFASYHVRPGGYILRKKTPIFLLETK